MGIRHDYAKSGIIFDFFGTSLGGLECDWWKIVFNSGDGIRDSSFLQSNLYHHHQTTYLTICGH